MPCRLHLLAVGGKSLQGPVSGLGKAHVDGLAQITQGMGIAIGQHYLHNKLPQDCITYGT